MLGPSQKLQLSKNADSVMQINTLVTVEQFLLFDNNLLKCVLFFAKIAHEFIDAYEIIG